MTRSAEKKQIKSSGYDSNTITARKLRERGQENSTPGREHHHRNRRSTRAAPDARVFYLSFAPLSKSTGHAGGHTGTTDFRRPRAGRSLGGHHCAPGHGIWLGRTSAAGVKSSCTQIWVPAGFRSLAAVAYPHTRQARQAVMNILDMPHIPRSIADRLQCTRSTPDLRVLISTRTISYHLKTKLLLLENRTWNVARFFKISC